jgi:uncharacterized circularly permuted ATP-grasp superfamily protein
VNTDLQQQPVAAEPPTSSRPAKRSRAYNEMRGPTGVSPAYRPLAEFLRSADASSLEHKRTEADALFRRRGITFNVYGDESGEERLIPFDVIPRILTAQEWSVVSAGCCQRVRALNRFLDDIYHDQEILKAGVIPRDEIVNNVLFRKEMVGLDLPNKVHAHIAGIDVVRVSGDQWYVLEDNLRTPSGVSYMIENRVAMRRLFPDFFRRQRVATIDHYPEILLSNLRACAPAGIEYPTVVVLTPGPANSAFFEHAFLAQRMGVSLVEGQDLFVDDGHVWMRDLRGRRQVDVIYRRVDDEFLDPTVFRPDSLLGVAGLMEVYRAGKVNLANAVGNGVADDKATYLYVPQMIEFYLGEKPILSNVPTWRLGRPDELAYVLEHLADLVVKEVHGSGGYGMLVGPASTLAEREAYRERILSDPSDFIAQPTLALSTCPTFSAQDIAPRHVDLRPYVLTGPACTLVPGALTRVALKEGSLVVNSSQGGGTKDTWVLDDQ